MRYSATLALLLAACDQTPMPAADMAGGRDGSMAAPIEFAFETVDANANGANIALVIDDKGAPHILYLQTGAEMDCNLGGTPTKYRPSQLFHATRAQAQGPAAFSKLMVSGAANDVVEPRGLSAVIEPKSGRPVVSYQGGQKGQVFCGGSDMIVARYTGAAWTRTPVADKSTAGVGPVEKSGDVVGSSSALAISKAGMWSLAWQDTHFGTYSKDDIAKADPEFASGPDGAFRTGEAVTPDGTDQDSAGEYNSMVLDAMDRPVLAYTDYRSGGVTVALRMGANMWKVTRLTSGGEFPPSIAFDAKSGRLGLAFYDPALKVLKLRESSDGVSFGPAEIVDQSGDVGRVVSLRYDQQGRAVLAYWRCGDYTACDPSKDALVVARREGPPNVDAWRYGVVDTGGDGSCGAVLALALAPDASADKAYVAYQCNPFDQASGQFKAIVRFAHEK